MDATDRQKSDDIDKRFEMIESLLFVMSESMLAQAEASNGLLWSPFTRERLNATKIQISFLLSEITSLRSQRFAKQLAANHSAEILNTEVDAAE